MNILFDFVIVLHVIVCSVLIFVVLLQQGRSADLAGAFGGQGSQTAFGPRAAANVLTRVTTWSAIIFMLTSIYESSIFGFFTCLPMPLPSHSDSGPIQSEASQ